MNRINTYDPLSDLFPQVFRGFVQPARGKDNGVARRVASMPLNVTEKEDAYVVQAEIPGVSKDAIKVEIDGDRVSVSAETKSETKSETEQKEGERLVRQERYEGTVARSLQFGQEIEEDSATASYENGVLELTLPKKAVAGVKRLTIS